MAYAFPLAQAALCLECWFIYRHGWPTLSHWHRQHSAWTVGLYIGLDGLCCGDSGCGSGHHGSWDV